MAIDFKALASDLSKSGQVPSSPAAQDSAAGAVSASTTPKVDPAKFGGRALQIGNTRQAVSAVSDRSKSASEKFDILRTIGNIPGSAANVVGDIVGAVAHPVRTVKAIGATALGAAEKLIPGRQGSEDAFDAVAQFYKDRYGSVDNALKSIQDDPVGVALDVAGILTAAGAGVRTAGTASKIGSVVRAGEAISAAGAAADPFAAAARAVGKGISRVGAPFASQVDPAVVAAEQRLRGISAVPGEAGAAIDLPAAALSKSNVVRGGSALAEKGLFGGRVTDALEATNKAIAQKAEALITRLDKAGADEGFVQKAGQELQAGFDDLVQTHRDRKTLLYEGLAEKTAAVRVPLTETRAKLTDILSRASIFPGAAQDVARNFLDQISGTKLAGKQGFALPNDFTFDEVKRGRTTIGGKLSQGPDVVPPPDKAVFDEIYAALSNDMDRALEAASPELAKEVRRVNAEFASVRELINSRLGRRLSKADPSKFVDTMIAPGNVEQARLAKRIIGNKRAGTLQAALMKKVIDASMTDGVLSGAKLGREIQRYTPSVLAEVLGRRQLSRLEDLQTLATSIQAGRRAATGSQTAFLQRLGVLGVGALANPALLIKALLLEGALSQVLSTKWGKQYLTTGSSTAKAIRAAIDRKAGSALGPAVAARQAAAMREATQK